MTMEHTLKIWPQFYQAVLSGEKNFEVRPNDRGFQKGDTVILREWIPEADQEANPPILPGYTNSMPLRFRIGYVLSLDNFWVAFSLTREGSGQGC